MAKRRWARLGHRGAPRRRARLRSRRQNERIFATGLRNLCRHRRAAGQRRALVRRQRARRARRQSPARLCDAASSEGAFYGWPWYYIGDHEDPRHKGERPDLAGQGHRAGRADPGAFGAARHRLLRRRQFPGRIQGDAFVALHGSWNRGERTGYKVVRLLLKDGKPTGEYEDFLTGFVVDDKSVGAARSASPWPMTARCSSARTATARSGGCLTRESDPSAGKRALHAQADRQQMVVFPAVRKELDAGRQTRGVRFDGSARPHIRKRLPRNV